MCKTNQLISTKNTKIPIIVGMVENSVVQPLEVENPLKETLNLIF